MKERRFTPTATQQFAHEDFVVRRRLPPLIIIALIFLVAYAVVLYLVYRAGARETLITLAIFLAFILGGLCMFVIAFTQRNRDLVLATEFQNMLFAAAASVKSDFVLITQRDGSVVYFNPGFQKRFGSQRHMSTMLDTVLESGRLSQDQQDKIRAAIAKNQYAQVRYHFSEGGKAQTMTLCVDPLARPRGYSLIRGVDPESATATTTASGDDMGTSGFLLDSLLHTVPFGLYTLSPERTVTFCNETFAHMLGMESGDIAGQNSISRLVRESEMAQLFGTSDFRGEVTFIKMNGAPVRLFVKQQTLFGTEGEVIGYKAIIEDKHVPPLRQNRDV